MSFVMEVQEWMQFWRGGLVVLRKVDVSRRYFSGVVVEMPVMRGRGHVDMCGVKAKCAKSI